MEPMPSLGRIYRLVIQEENQQRTADYNKGGDKMVLAARSHVHLSLRNIGGKGQRGVQLGFPKENPRGFKKLTDGSDFVEQLDGPQSLLAASGSDGPHGSNRTRSDGPRGGSFYGPDGSREFLASGSDGPYGPTLAQVL